MQRLTAVLFLVLFLLVLGCEDRVYCGTVVGKEQEEAKTLLVPVAAGKAVVLMPIYHQEAWYLEISDGQRSSLVRIEAETYHQYNVGDQVDLTPEGRR